MDVRVLARRDAPALQAQPIETVMRLAVLLSAGASPVTAWTHLAHGGDPVLRAAADAAAAGADVGAVLARAGGSWSAVAAVWTVAVETGAPLADTLRSVAGALREAVEVGDEVRVALAEPAATARLLGWLPLLGVPLGAALGFDPLAVLTRDPVGVACLGGGVLLVVVARIWTMRLTRSARPPLTVPGLHAELWAVALSAGASVDRARAAVEAAARGPSPPSDTETDTQVVSTIELATLAGVPAAQLLRGDAWLARHRARTAGRTAAARLSTRLLLPLGACTLPAFLLLAVAPMMLAILRSSALP